MPQEKRTSMYQELFQFPPGRAGYYGPFGGAFIPEILHETIAELQAAFAAAQADPTFWDEYVRLMASYCSPGAWGKAVSSPRPVLASTASPRPPWPPAWVLTVPFIWGP